MTSAPNHRLQLNGNSPFRSLFIVLFSISLLLFGTSCELFKPMDNGNTTMGRDRPRDERTDERNTDRNDDPAEELDPIQSRRVYDPATGRYVYVTNAPTEEMDTVRWRLVSEANARPITEEGTDVFNPVVDPNNSNNPVTGNQPIEQIGVSEDGSRLLSSYRVDFLLPFLANRLEAGGMDGTELPVIDPNSLWSLHFYSGAQMALDDLKSQDISLNVSAHDTQASPEKTNQLLRQQDTRAAQMLIGPYLRSNVAAAAEAVRNQEQVLISPYSAADGISTNNPNYVQVNPTLNTHLRSLLQHATTTKRNDRIILVGGPQHRDRLAFLQEEYRIMSGNLEIPPLEELIIEQPETDITPYLDGRGTVFIVPIYEDESFVANFLRLVYNANRMNQDRVATYGLPQWKNYSRIDFDYYEGANVHISSSTFINKLDPTVRQFRQDFYNRFKTIPREEAYIGYDVTNYFARMISKYGTRFQYSLSRNPEKLMHTEFRFEPMMYVSDPNASNFEQATVDHWENTFVNILQFKNYQFQKVN